MKTYFTLREQARRVYYGAVFEIKIPLEHNHVAEADEVPLQELFGQVGRVQPARAWCVENYSDLMNKLVAIE